MNWAVKSLIIKLITLMCQTRKVSGADEQNMYKYIHVYLIPFMCYGKRAIKGSEMIHYGNSI